MSIRAYDILSRIDLEGVGKAKQVIDAIRELLRASCASVEEFDNGFDCLIPDEETVLDNGDVVVARWVVLRVMYGVEKKEV